MCDDIYAGSKYTMPQKAKRYSQEDMDTALREQREGIAEKLLSQYRNTYIDDIVKTIRAYGQEGGE